VSRDGAAYRFWLLDANDRWPPSARDDMLAARALPAGISVAAHRYAGAAVAPDAILPLRASGRNEPYEIVVSSAEATFLVSSDPLNRVAIAAPAR
jgi:hypothetical protein